jgi:Asp-tRNA(Asn)/Glu-tRNA(Gln) amidotransferase A subunit family amidase
MSQDVSVHSFTARQYRDWLADGHADLVEFYEQQLAFVQAADAQIHAFANLDERVIRLQVQHHKMDRMRGQPAGRMFGVPVAVKDVIDTVDFPTGCGSPLHEGRYPVADATVVRRLRDAGAVIFGKTVTTEFATSHPGPTRNPHKLAHTPGGSSSGSAAAVAAGMVPLALGTQTNGSVIRPASYCGVYGFKPSRGLLPRSGVFEQSPSLDQMGVFGRCIEDVAWAAEIMSGDDGLDPACKAVMPQTLLSVACAEPPLPPRFCFVRTPWWEQVDPQAREAYEAFLELMEGVVQPAELPAVVEQAVHWHHNVNDVELAFALQHEYHHQADALSPELRQRIERGMNVPAMDYLLAQNRMPHVACAFDEYFDNYDAILCPAALGGAPQGLASTGDPIMQTVWSFAGLPALSLPLLNLSGNLPLGVQAVGSHRNDARLLRSARWLVHEFVKRSAA